MTFVIGLTGSIGMGKSTTARQFAEQGCAVWDADAAVHRLYTAGGAAVAPLAAIFPDAVIDGAISRNVLKSIIGQNPQALMKIEKIVHPLVAKDRADFIASTESDIIVLDIPLLFETGGEARVDATVCVSIDVETQKARVMARGTMTEEQFNTILAKQMPDADKRARADYVIVTDTIDHGAEQVKSVLADIRKRMTHA
ncbi:MAG: dephospho-CoA kinase [Paracoccaceae bacterium]|uniref:dephospho-CoA kinase n=1 Tax=Seohaeicola saemankumensis TaxID=481181 RepID=UPI001E655B4D|nr:dephospho-CoA kinase [Seohaeicola saemankumensis]MCD1624983.1 dephospho-CoA kinase [Seohaeicola saemankumensis]